MSRVPTTCQAITQALTVDEIENLGDVVEHDDGAKVFGKNAEQRQVQLDVVSPLMT